MSALRRLAILLLASYGIGVLASRWLVFGTFALDRPTVAGMIAVPLVQAALLAGWRQWRRRRQP